MINEADNGSGVIRFILTQVNVPPVNGEGLLASISFIGFSPGSSNLTFSIVKLADSGAQEIATTSEPGQATVSQPGGEPTATFTPLPIPTATSPIDAPPPDTPVPPEPTATLTPLPTSTPVELTATPIAVTASPQPAETPAVTATPLGVPLGATIGFCYRVQYGETFYSLTHKFGVGPHTLNVVNDLWPRNYVFTHQAIFIPTRLGHGPNFYVVQPDDTLPAIADRCHLPVEYVAQVNYLDPEGAVSPGQVLEIPVPPFPPPSRYNYPAGPGRFGPCSAPHYSGCDAYLPYRPGPPLGD